MLQGVINPSLKIGVTGSEGLIGTALCARLRSEGHNVTGFDHARPRGTVDYGDILDATALRQFADGCDGIVHLAGVSRVVWGERDPELCMRTNSEGTRTVLDSALRAAAPPFVLIASSREVYGELLTLPATEDAPLRPINVYGRSKAQAEEHALAARARGLATAVLRFSNVYGSINDHADRVVPAFARASSEGSVLRIDGADHTFDFTHVDDVVRGISAVIALLVRGVLDLPPIHLVTGRATTLADLAELAIAAGGGRAQARLSQARHYDVSRFVGDFARAKARLGWVAERSLEEGICTLVSGFRDRARITNPTAGLDR